MALVWGDGFDHYGANSTYPLQNGYSAFSVLWDTVNKRTGSACIRLDSDNARPGIRRPMTAANRIVQGTGIRVVNPPSDARANIGVGLRGESAAGVQEYRIVPNTQLGFNVYDRGFVLRGQSPNGLFNLNSWNWIEAQADVNSAGANTGTLVVRFEGDPVVTVNGINLPNQFQNHCLGHNDNSGWGDRGDIMFDDYVICDGTGARNNSFLGDRRCDTSYLDADTALAQWALVGGATGFGILDNVPPNDLQYIEALAAGNISEFEHAPLTVQSNDVAGVIGFARLVKSDAGVSTVRLGINSSGNVNNGPAISPGTSFNYTNQIWELDPNGNIPWTRATVDLAMVRLTRDV